MNCGKYHRCEDKGHQRNDWCGPHDTSFCPTAAVTFLSQPTPLAQCVEQKEKVLLFRGMPPKILLRMSRLLSLLMESSHRLAARECPLPDQTMTPLTASRQDRTDLAVSIREC
eukprot:m.48555 g.48555  ORF g.48555 m.48555 type:complete len:113 (+) comp8921_c0_seq1:2489-2827(+)